MKIKIATCQYPIEKINSLDHWITKTEKWITDAHQANCEVILFPEYGCMELTSLLPQDDQESLERQLVELQKIFQTFFNTFKTFAEKYKMLIISPSFPQLLNGKYINRCHIFFPDGTSDHQDKIMMTRFEDEEWGITSSEENFKVFEYKKMKFGINICFDGEFPIFSMKQSLQGIHVLFHPSCTESDYGMERIHVSARARALENQIYVVVAQTVGDAPWSIAVDKNTGKAAFYSTCDKLFPSDGILAIGEKNKAQQLIYELDLNLLEEIRKNGQVFNYKGIKKSINYL